MASATIYLGLDVGGTKCAAVVGDGDGHVHDRTEWPSHTQRGPEPMIEDLCRHGQALVDRTGPVAAAGVAIGGPLDSSKGIIYSPPNLPGWDGVALRQQLQEALGLPVVVVFSVAVTACPTMTPRSGNWHRMFHPMKPSVLRRLSWVSTAFATVGVSISLKDFNCSSVRYVMPVNSIMFVCLWDSLNAIM